MKRTQLYIDPSTYSLAVLQAQKEGTSLSEIMRKSIKAYAKPEPKKNRRKFLQWLTDFHKKFPTPPGTPTDIAMEHDHYLYGTPKKYSKK